MKTTQELRDEIESIEAQLDAMTDRAESGDDWAEISQLEDRELVPLLEELERREIEEAEANGQFGVGA